MAKCERIGAKPVPPPAGYQLTLSEEEAQFLRALLGGHIIGQGSVRDMSGRIYSVLRDAGVPRRALDLMASRALDGKTALRLFGWRE